MLNKILIAVIIICGILLIGILLIVFVFNSPSGKFSENEVCSCTNDLDCTDFATHADAQACFEFCGGTNNDFHRLDNDGNGLACESLE